MPRTSRAPVSTYRFQLTSDFGFASVAKCAPYLEQLGITHAYFSPILQAVPGSRHGYDVINHGIVSEELGGENALKLAAQELAAHGISIIVDIVPNHMAIPTPERLNPALWSILRDGPDSPFADWFDVDVANGQRILLPILSARIDEIIDSGELQVVRGAGPEGESVLRYYDHEVPIRRGTEHLPLPELLGSAYYRLAHWQIAAEELNYRRFFDVDTLVAIRVEDPAVFAHSHSVLIRLIHDGTLSGLRIDHPDGLADPRHYLDRLARRAEDRWVAVEKILAAGEDLPLDWVCDGTTGYEAIAMITPLFVDPDGAAVLQDAFAESTGELASWEETAYASKRAVLAMILVSELDRLAALAHSVCQATVRLRDYSLRGLTEGLAELLANLGVYRAHVIPGEPAAAVSRAHLRRATAAATQRLPRRIGEISLLSAMALGEVGRSDSLDEFIVRFQQTSGPVMAKGVEDTALYRWFPLSSLCEVGTEPNRFGVGAGEFHQWCERRQSLMPETLNALSTHDTKRSEDVRARISALSEVAGAWVEWMQIWHSLAGPFVAPSGERDARTEWLLWQTMIGAWPIDRERMGQYLTKAVREAKLHTSWSAPDEMYESALGAYVDSIYANGPLLESFGSAVNAIHPGFVTNSLGQRAIQLLIPGIPDIYQGCETVKLRLVDPDNRVAVDQELLAEILRRSPDGVADPLLDLGSAKMLLTMQGLQLRQRHPRAVGPRGAYQPLVVNGPAEPSVIAFARGTSIACVVTRYALRTDADELRATTVSLLSGRWRNLLTGSVIDVTAGNPVPLRDVLGQWPVAILEAVATVV